MSYRYGDECWRFETANFRVVAYAAPEEWNPADSFEFDEDIEAVRNGDVEWFKVAVVVYHKVTGAELGTDFLGGCAYKTVDEFFTGHRDPNPMHRNCSIQQAATGYSIGHYFPGMVGEAIGEARRTLADMCSTRLRNVA